MKLKLDDKNQVVVEDGKPVYVYSDGKEVAFDAAASVAKISALNAEARDHRIAKEAAETKVKAFEGIDDPAAAKKALETLQNIDEGKLITAGKVEEIKNAAKRAAEEQVAAANKANAEKLQETTLQRDNLQNELYSEKIGGSFTRSKFISDKVAVPPDMLQAQFGRAFKIEDGNIVAYDSKNAKIFSRAKPGELADFDEAIETLIDAYPYKANILKGSGASGGGTQQSGGVNGASKTMTRGQWNALPDGQKGAAARENTITD